MPEYTEKTPTIGVLIHSFFVIPFVIAIVAVLLFLSMRLLTSESKTPADYLNDIKVGGHSKRWQAAFELSKLIADPKLRPTDPQFQQEMVAVFNHSIHDDVRVRDYLAVAMGRSGQDVYVETLVDALKNEDEPAALAIIYALGLLQDRRSFDVVKPYFSHSDARVRLAVVTCLGNMGGREVQKILRKALLDDEANVRWEAAISLAKMKDASGKKILLDMMQRKYWDSFVEVDRDEQNRAIKVAIQASVLLNDGDLNSAIAQLGLNDSNLDVRNMAKKALAKKG